ncbi:MAG: hypothetical protein ABI685_15055, partial [Ferruginibacter sp.]
MEYFLFSFCLLLIIWGCPKIGFIKRSGLSAKEIRSLLFFKIITGLLFAYYFKNLSGNHDYNIMNEEGILHYKLLISNPSHFFNDLSSDIQQYGFKRLFETKDSFWAYLRFNLLYKGIAILNLLTHGNFYFNTAIFCSLVFFGHVAFFRIYYSIYKAHKWKILFACFCLPSLLLYTACIHKDGIIFLCVGMISYIFYRFLSGLNYKKWYYLLIVFFSMLLVFLFRNYVLVALLPAMFVGVAGVSLKWKQRYIFIGCYLVFIVAFFINGVTTSSFNLPAAVVQRKADFASL